MIICRVCEAKAEPHPDIKDMCQWCGDTDWYALSNGLSTVMPDGTVIYAEEEPEDSKP